MKKILSKTKRCIVILAILLIPTMLYAASWTEVIDTKTPARILTAEYYTDSYKGKSHRSSGFRAPESIELKSIKKNKPIVLFPHKKHVIEFNVTCKTCHHTLKSDSETPRACSVCHKRGADTPVRGASAHFQGEKTVVNGPDKAPDPCFNEKCTKNIYHDKCRSCHKEKDKGPRKCKECHVK